MHISDAHTIGNPLIKYCIFFLIQLTQGFLVNQKESITHTIRKALIIDSIFVPIPISQCFVVNRKESVTMIEWI